MTLAVLSSRLPCILITAEDRILVESMVHSSGSEHLCAGSGDLSARSGERGHRIRWTGGDGPDGHKIDELLPPNRPKGLANR